MISAGAVSRRELAVSGLAFGVVLLVGCAPEPVVSHCECASVIDDKAIEVQVRARDVLVATLAGHPVDRPMLASLLSDIDGQGQQMNECALGSIMAETAVHPGEDSIGKRHGDLNGWYSDVAVGLMILSADGAISDRAREHLVAATNGSPPKFSLLSCSENPGENRDTHDSH